MRLWMLVFWVMLAVQASGRLNVLFLCVDDLRPELGAFGAGYVESPAMDGLAASGRAFERHYVQAPTCGASRYALLTGRYGGSRRGNDAIFQFAAQHGKEAGSLPEVMRGGGYVTVAVGKVSHHPGGLGGAGWNDPRKVELPGGWDRSYMPGQPKPWKDPQAAMHGYADGKARKAGVTPATEHVAGDDMTYTDGWIAAAAMGELEELKGQAKPFFLAVGLMKPHLPFACPEAYRDRYAKVALPPIPHPAKPPGLTTWHKSEEFMGNYSHAGRDPRTDPAYADELRRSYAACVTYADTQIGKILAKLGELGLAESTIVVLWGDHGYHLGEHSIWGKHSLFEESLRSPLIIRVPGMVAGGTPAPAVVETVDIYPTLAELCKVAVPAGLSGQSLVPMLNKPDARGRSAISYSPSAVTIRTETHRLIRHNGSPAGIELYDHRGAGETENIAAKHPEIVAMLAAEIDARMEPKR
jgi:iduronate 2-sulfatase